MREPEHPHRLRSVMWVDAPARIRYDRRGVLTYESPAEPAPGAPVEWREPGGPHAVENVDDHHYHGIRVELKDAG